MRHKHTPPPTLAYTRAHTHTRTLGLLRTSTVLAKQLCVISFLLQQSDATAYKETLPSPSRELVFAHVSTRGSQRMISDDHLQDFGF